MNIKKDFYTLLLEKDDYVEIKDAAEKFQVSSRTIYNYLNHLESMLDDRDLRIERKSGKGILLKGTSEEKQQLEKELLKDLDLSTEGRRQVIFEDLLMRGKTVSINSLSERFYVSRSSIVNDLNYVEKELKKYQLNLSKTISGTCVGGDEVKVREAQKQYILKQVDEGISKETDTIRFVSKIMLQYTSQKYLEEAKTTIHFCEEQLKFQLNLVYYMQLYVSLVIYFNRLSRQQYIFEQSTKLLAIELYEFRTYPAVLQICEKMKERGIHVPQEEIDYLNNMISAVYKDDNNVNGTSNAENIEMIVNHMVNSLKDVFQTDFSKDHLLINELSKHIEGMVNRVQCNIKISNPYISQIKKQYAALYSMVALASTEIEHYFNITLSEDEISFILIYFQAAVERANMSKKIIIIVDKIDPYATLLQSKIRKSIVMFDVMEIVEKNKIETEYINEFDFAVTTMKMEGISIPNIQVSLSLSDEELENVNKMYFKSFKVDFNSNFALMIECLNPENLFLHKEYTSMEECLKEACDILQEQGCVDEYFFDAVMRRERLAPTNVVDGVAMPHGLDKNVKKNRITLITLDHPFAWGDKKVDIIILLAVNFINKSNTQRLLSELYFFISDKEKLAQLRQCHKYADVIRLLL